MKHNHALIFIVLAAVIVGGIGCAGSPMANWRLRAAYDKVRSENRTNLLKLQLGMTKPEVLEIMGTEEKEMWGGIGHSERINNPFKSEIMNGTDGPLEVIYYYTDIQKRDGAITDDELTPIIFKDGAVIGWGRSFLDNTIDKYEVRIR